MKFNLSTCLILLALQCFLFNANAQTVTIYRGGVAISPVYSTIAAAAAAILNGDSAVISAHTFYEFNIQLPTGTIWKGTQTTKDSTIIDAQKKGVGLSALVKVGILRNIIVRDIIITNGEGGGMGNLLGADTLKLKGYSIVRNCHSDKCGGAALNAFLYDHAKLTNNSADSFGGGASNVWAFDSAEICYNSAPYGGGIGYEGAGGRFYCNSPGVRVHHNTATIGGGGIYGQGEMTAGQITDNQAPLGAAWHTVTCGNAYIRNSYIYNPTLAGKRQNEVYVRSGFFNMEGSWFGKSDTIGLIKVGPTPCDPLNAVRGKYAKANWSINKGKPITNKDTLFPIGSGFTYSDGSPLPPNALPWLQGKFSSSTGKMLTPNPRVSASDTMSSLFRTYVYTTKGDTTSKPINFICIVDADTFRTSPRVWGIDSIKLSIGPKTLTTVVRVYPNPTSDYIHIEGLETGTSIELYDLSGKLVKNEKLKNNNAVLDVQSLPAGLYTLKITSKEGAVGTAKVMKE
jgi:hypothetical protein